MRINNIGYLLKEGIKGIFQHGFMSFAAVCVTVACLLIVGSFSCLTYNLNIMVDDLNKTNEITVYVDTSLSDAEARSIGTKINRVDNVAEARFIDRADAFENFKSTMENPDAFDGFDSSYIEHRYSVILVDNRLLEDTMAELNRITGVSSISAAKEMAEGFTTLQDILQVVSLVIIAVLLVVSLLIISNTVKLAMYDRKDEIAIMKMVGATNGFIRLPFVIEGFTLGMLGAGVAFGLQWLLYDALVNWINGVDTFRLFRFQPFDVLLIPMLMPFAFAGLFVGVVGSWTSIRKFMDV